MAKSADPTPSAVPDRSASSGVRRNFLVNFAALTVGGLVSLFGLCAGLFTFADPLRRERRVPLRYRDAAASSDGFIRVATLDSVPDDGTPRLFPVLSDRLDAWNYFPNEPVGVIYLRRTEGQVQAMHTTCPHLGCTIAYADAARRFQCPCHESAFTLEGERIEQPGKVNPSPRDMDELEVDAERLAEVGEVWVRFVNFRTGDHRKVPRA